MTAAAAAAKRPCKPAETFGGVARRVTSQRKKPAVYGHLRVLVDPKTGEEKRCIAFEMRSDIEQIRERNFKNGDLVRVTVSKAVDPWINRAVHALGKLVVQNIEGFESMTAHQALKRLQVESGIHCEPILVEGRFLVNIPVSLAFGETDDAEWRVFARGIAQYLVKRYWPTTTPEAIEEMAELNAKVENV
jgi:hypothetical protein